MFPYVEVWNLRTCLCVTIKSHVKPLRTKRSYKDFALEKYIYIVLLDGQVTRRACGFSSDHSTVKHLIS